MTVPRPRTIAARRPGASRAATKLVTAGIAATFALVLALALSAAAGARSQATAISLGARLDIAQEVPAPAGDLSSAGGTFAATASRSGEGVTLAWRLTFSGLSGPAAAAHVHVAPRGQAGPVAIPLCGPCEAPASGTASLDAATLEALQNGGAYVNVHTAANKAGEVRGQIGITATVKTALNARQEVPKPKGRVGRASGTFAATVTRTGETGTITWRLTHARLTGRAVAAHIHMGRRGQAGPVVLPLCGPCRSGARRTAALSPAVQDALAAGRAYVNVHTARNRAGEIRGQLPAAALRLTP